MKIGVCIDRIEESWTYSKSGEIFFSPLFELFAAMHVICNPAHHTSRQKWWERVSWQVDSDLISDIRSLDDATSTWLAPMDFVFINDYIDIRDMDIEEALHALEGYPIRYWKKIFAANGLNITPTIKKKIIDVSRAFYETFFHTEIRIIEPLMNAALKKILTSWEREGIAKSVANIHERLKLTENEIVFYKNREYHYSYDEIDKIYLTGSLFLSPHLIMGNSHKSILVVKHFYTEEADNIPPQELIDMYKGLADGTRLQILKKLKHKPDTTQHLAVELGISEAAVSKQLKILSAGRYVEKNRNGNYMVYSVNEDTLDFLTYRIYEFLM